MCVGSSLLQEWCLRWSFPVRQLPDRKEKAAAGEAAAMVAAAGVAPAAHPLRW